MGYAIKIDLMKDWKETVQEIFRGSGHPLPPDMSDKEIGISYFMQTADNEEEAESLHTANEARLNQIQSTILEHFDTVILPDIRKRTRYTGDEFYFRWVFWQGEHIVEEMSEYRIPVGQ